VTVEPLVVIIVPVAFFLLTERYHFLLVFSPSISSVLPIEAVAYGAEAPPNGRVLLASNTIPNLAVKLMLSAGYQ